MVLSPHRQVRHRSRYLPATRRRGIGSQTLRMMSLMLAGLAWSTPSLAEDNLARGRPYQLNPRPNYKACTDKGDAVQLTDGVRRESNWLQISTVGWKDQSQPATIQIDLGSVQAIDEVRISSVGGGHAGVFFPALILVMVSDDGMAFHVAKILDHPMAGRSDPDHPRRVPHVFRLSGLGTRGRFVHVTLLPDQRYLFLDEIEVIRGRHDVGSVRFASSNLYRADQVKEILAAIRPHHPNSPGPSYLEGPPRSCATRTKSPMCTGSTA